MNKKLLCIAVASAVSIPLAANAATDLKIYGGVGVAVESIDVDAGGDALAVNNNHSAIGFEGSTDINSDLKGVFHWDVFVDIDAGGGNAGGNLINGGRDGWAGLRGEFGTVALGFQGRPWKTLSHGLDPFQGTIADYSSVLGTTGGASYFDGGIGNAIIWFGPNVNGLSWHLQYGAEDVADGASNTGAQVNYSSGPLFVGASYDSNEDTTNGDDETAMKVVGSYKVNTITLTAAFETISNSGMVDGADRDAFWLAASADMGGGSSVRAAYTSADDIDGTSDTGASQVSLGYFASLSNNASWYAIYSAISNDAGGNYGFISAPHTSSHDLTAGTGDDSNAIAVGFKYDFSADLI